VPLEYDPLLAKLAVWANTRDDSVARMIRALNEYEVGGIRTNIGFFRQIFEDEAFRAGRLHTGFIEEFFKRPRLSETPAELAEVAALAAALDSVREERRPGSSNGASSWVISGRQELLR
jgi:acetyl-CoA carboxylase biotin carboxylase subunit